MKTFLVKNSTPLGYSLEVLDDEGNTTTLEILGTDPKNPKVLHLPQNPSNRQWVTPKGDDRQELAYKAPRTLSPRTSDDHKNGPVKVIAKGWETYLTDEEREMVEKLKTKALARKQVADLKAQKAALEEQLKALEENEMEGE